MRCSGTSFVFQFYSPGFTFQALSRPIRTAASFAAVALAFVSVLLRDFFVCLCIRSFSFAFPRLCRLCNLLGGWGSFINFQAYCCFWVSAVCLSGIAIGLIYRPCHIVFACVLLCRNFCHQTAQVLSLCWVVCLLSADFKFFVCCIARDFFGRALQMLLSSFCSFPQKISVCNLNCNWFLFVPATRLSWRWTIRLRFFKRTIYNLLSPTLGRQTIR